MDKVEGRVNAFERVVERFSHEEITLDHLRRSRNPTGQILRIKIGAKTLFRVSDLDAYIDSKVQRLKPGA